MTRALRVHLDGVLAGSLTTSTGGTLAFEYDDDYRSAPDATPLSLSMPLATRRHKQRVVLPFVQGLLPDNEQALESMARTFQVSARSPFALLEHMGHDVAGALQLVRPGEESEDAVADRSSQLTAVTDEDVATELARTIVAYRTGQPYATTWGRISLAGAQPKLGLVRAPDGTWHMPGRGVPTTHILKPELTAAGERYPALTVVEAFGLAVAGHAGLRVPGWSIWTSPDESIRALVVERYDRRVDEDGVVRRLHQEDLCQALAVSPAQKYQHQDGGPGIGQIGELLRFRVPRPDAAGAARSFLAGLTFNIAFLNTDAHAKNYSVMLSGAHVEMSPLYDLTSYALYTDDDGDRPLSFPMHVGGDYRFRSILPSAIVQEGVRLGLHVDDATDVVHGVLGRLPEAFEKARQDLAGVPDGERVTDTVVANLPKLSPLYGAAVGSPVIIDLSPGR